ncbi:zinc finger-like domain-containing protein [Phytohabitans houttuyneae]|uniref:Uncharacterized protein n=1 Tax=Phytohabitans houttuyneae TaxID=1076126 RepID=A0A6V8K4H1_9ACTN|nr:zinc finger-like domain-containing protein [Phytohabitans houttuyneae]GFJ80082.1 hypothetical protein Phou_042620 [Phytohabitans houttuyneae]
MPILAATATPTPSMIMILLLATAVVTLGYAVTCWLWPFKRCRRCHGTGRRRGPILRMYRLCRRCHGDGLRLRIGRRIGNHLRELHRNAR